MARTGLVQLLRMPRATFQALMPTGNLALSRAVTLAMTATATGLPVSTTETLVTPAVVAS